MKQWTLEERYRVLESPEDIRDLHKRICKSSYRQAYHIQPVTGLSSDPNGFVFFENQWHLFYQWCPWGAVHGLKYWYHVVSEDLVHWHNAGIGLKPNSDYDNKGTHSGSGIAVDGELYFFYTGNHRDENWIRTPYTCAAKMGKDGQPVKFPAPLFGPRADYSEHQRDPKVFYNEERQTYYIFIGAQTLDKKGCVQVYQSKKLLEGWEFAGQLKVPGYENFGGMWECPCVQRIGGKDVLIFSPQYTKLPGRAESTNHNVYFIGKIDYETLTFVPEGDYHHLDFGFDFYAAQLASNVGDPDRAVLIAWIGLPDNHYPTEPEEWEGSMCLPRELRIRNGKLIQNPVPEIAGLVGDKVEGNILPNACMINLQTKGNDLTLRLFAKENGTGGLLISYDAASRTFTMDKTGMDKRYNEKVGEVLTMPLDRDFEDMRIYIDHSSTEIFVNGGEATFTTHSYPTAEEKYIALTGEADVEIRTMATSVKDDFVV